MFPAESETIRIDSIVEKEVIFRDTVFVPTPDSLVAIIHDPCPEDLPMQTIRSKKGEVKATVERKKGKLTLRCRCDPEPVKAKLREWITRYRITTDRSRLIVQKPSRWQTFFAQSGKVAWGAFVIALFILGFRFRKKLMSFFRPI